MSALARRGCQDNRPTGGAVLSVQAAFRFRAYQPGDEVSINHHFNAVFELHRPLSEWGWKFQPEQDGCTILLGVNAKDEIIAQYAVIQTRMQMDGLVFRAGQPVDVFCLRQDGATQRRVYPKMVHEFFQRYGNPEHLPLLFGFPGKRALRLGQLKLGYGEPVPIRFWQREVTRRRLIWKKRSPQGAPNLDAFERLWQRAAGRYAVSTIRDARWLKQRYLDRPNNPYVHICIPHEQDVQAWAVLRFEKNTAHWVDLVWDGSDSNVLRRLEERCVESARLAGASQMEMWLSGDAEAEAIFAGQGWQCLEHPLQLQLVARSFDPQIDAAHLIQHAYLTMGNADLV